MGDRPTAIRRLSPLVQACVLGAGLWPVHASLADNAAETCFPIYGKGKAVPRTKDCEAKAASAPTDLSTYFCVSSPTLIQRFCDAQCEVDPLQPVTDPDALGFEDGSNRVREDKLSESMSTKLNCLRDAVSNAGGTLTVTSAWRPQSYQDHLNEVVTKNALLTRLVLREHVEECRPSPHYNAVHPHHVAHGLNSHAAGRSLHTSGEAFDASWSGIANNHLDTLADQCGLFRPLPRPVSQGGDPVHFQHKPRMQNMSPLLALPAFMMAASVQAAMYSPEQLGLSITSDGVHVRQDDGSVIAVYTYTITNRKAPQIRAITVGADTDDPLAPPLLNDKNFLINRDWLSAPAQWTGTVSVLEESTRKVIEWEPAEPDNWDIGVFPGQTITLTVRAQAALPDLLTTTMMVHMKTFKYLKTPAIQLTPSDTTAPTLTTQLDIAPAPDRPGWLKVSAGHAVLDNHDPYPQTVLSRIDSNQPITDKDIDAAIGTPAPVFYLKQAKGRTYTVSYRAMDASGNASTSRSLVDASK